MFVSHVAKWIVNHPAHSNTATDTVLTTTNCGISTISASIQVSVFDMTYLLSKSLLAKSELPISLNI
jgi:hypothetical protein